MGRKPLPPANKRSEKLYTKTYPAAADEFRTTCERIGLTEAEALRQALEAWMKKNGER